MSDTDYRISFFGKPKITVLEQELKIKSKRVFALLASVQTQMKPFLRQEIQRLLWLQDEGLDESVYAGRLRVLLYSNKEVVEQFLNVGVADIGFKYQTSERQGLSDIQIFDSLIKNGSIDSLKEAVELYTGEFMQGFKMRDSSYEFEDLLVQQRVYWQDQVVNILDEVVSKLLSGRRKVDLAESLYYAQKSLSINPFRDESQILLAKIYCRNRQQQQAINQLENYIDRLKQSLNMDAGKDVYALLYQLRSKQLPEHQKYRTLKLREVPEFRRVNSY